MNVDESSLASLFSMPWVKYRCYCKNIILTISFRRSDLDPQWSKTIRKRQVFNSNYILKKKIKIIFFTCEVERSEFCPDVSGRPLLFCPDFRRLLLPRLALAPDLLVPRSGLIIRWSFSVERCSRRLVFEEEFSRLLQRKKKQWGSEFRTFKKQSFC